MSSVHHMSPVGLHGHVPTILTYVLPVLDFDAASR